MDVIIIYLFLSTFFFSIFFCLIRILKMYPVSDITTQNENSERKHFFQFSSMLRTIFFPSDYDFWKMSLTDTSLQWIIHIRYFRSYISSPRIILSPHWRCYSEKSSSAAIIILKNVNHSRLSVLQIPLKVIRKIALGC